MALLPDERFFPVAVQVSPSRIKTKVVVLLDSDTGISIDECADISRRLGQELDTLPELPEAYTLEVSSPGIDYPLSLPRQFRRNVGRRLRIWLADGRELTGLLTDATDTGLTLSPEAPASGRKKAEPLPPLHLPYGEVQKAVVQVSFK